MNNKLLFRIGQVLTSIWLGVSFLFFFYPIRNINIVFVVLTIGLLFLLIELFSKRITLFLSLGRLKGVILILFLLLLPTILLFSLKGNQSFLVDNSMFVIVVVYLGAFTTLSLAVALLIQSILAVNGVTGDRTVSKKMIIMYALPSLIVWTGYWIAFFPGAMTPDSLAQWDQAHTLDLNNWHPVVYTLLIAFLTNIWDSPAIVTLTQVIIIATIIGYTCYSFDRFKFPKWTIWSLSIIFAISPVNSTYSITIWKDVLYSAFLMLFTLLLIHIVKSNGNWIKGKSHYLLLLLTCLSVIFFRHNGLPVVIISLLVALVLYRHTFKQLGSLIGLVLVIYFVVNGPVFDAMDVKPSDPNEALSIPTQQLATIITEDGYMTDEQREYFNSIFPIELWKERFHPYNTNPIKFSWAEYDRDIIFADTGKYFKNWLQVSIQNPYLALKGFFTHTSLVWQINEPEEPGYTDTYVTNVYYGNEFGIENTVISSKITALAAKYLTITKEWFSPIIWRPAVYTYAILLLAIAAYIRTNYKPLLIALPVLLNTAAVMAAIPAQDFRYLYSNTLILFLILFAAFMHFEPKVRRQNE